MLNFISWIPFVGRFLKGAVAAGIQLAVVVLIAALLGWGKYVAAVMAVLSVAIFLPLAGFVAVLAWTLSWSLSVELTGCWWRSVKDFVLRSPRNGWLYVNGGSPDLDGDVSDRAIHTFGFASVIFLMMGAMGIGGMLSGEFDFWDIAFLIAFLSLVTGAVIQFLSIPGIKEVLMSAPMGQMFVQALKIAAKPGEFLSFVDGTLRIGDMEIPFDVENLSFAIFGSPGSGKTQAINRMLLTIRHRGQCAIVADVGGEAMSQMAKAGDQVLNPLDARSVKWSPFAEMENTWDAETIARSIIPDLEGAAKEWSTYAQVLLGAVMRRLWETNNATNGSLLHYLVFAKPEEVATLVAGLPISALFDKGSAKMLSNVRSIIGTSIGAYSYLDPNVGADGFSVKRFVMNESNKADAPFLWLPYRDSQTAVLGGMISSWMDLASQTLLDLDTDRNRRFWFVADEFSSLPRVNSIMQLLAKGRKKGVGAIFGIQTIAQVRQSYGREGQSILMTCLQTWAAFRSRDPETQRFLQELAGEHTFTREETSVSKRGGWLDGDASTTTAYRHAKEDRVLRSDFGRLATRHGFMSIPGPYELAYVVAPIVAIEQRVKNFIPVKRAEQVPAVNVRPINVIELAEVAKQQEKENSEFIEKMRILFPAGESRIPTPEEIEQGDDHEYAAA